MPPTLVVEGSSWVEPAAPIKAQTVQLSLLDNQCAQVYPCGFWFFPEHKDQKDALFHYAQLKRGLERLLVQQSLIGGTIEQNERGTFRVEIPAAPKMGIRFYYRDLYNDPTFPSIQQIASARYPIIDGMTDGFEKLRPDTFPTSSAGDPVFLAQLTRCRGGLCMFAAVTHLLGDLLQPRLIMIGWSEQTALVAGAAFAAEPEPPLPRRLPDILLDRSRFSQPAKKPMSYKEVQAVCASWGNIMILDPTEPLQSAEMIRDTFPQAFLLPQELQREDHLRTVTGAIFRISAESIKTLVYLARSHTDKKISTVDTLISFVWQRFFYTKYGLAFGAEADANRPKNAACIFPGNIRGRLTPPMPALYLGACVDLFKAVLPERELLPAQATAEAFGKSLCNGALNIRDANTQFKEDRFMQLVDMAAATPKHTAFLPAGPIDLLVTDHSQNVALRNADFGHGLGISPEIRQPYFGRDMPAGEVTLLPRCNDGDMEIMITAERVVLLRLAEDPVWSKFAKTVFITYDARAALMQPTALGGQIQSKL